MYPNIMELYNFGTLFICSFGTVLKIQKVTWHGVAFTRDRALFTIFMARATHQL